MMKNLKRNSLIMAAIFALLLLVVATAQAQQERGTIRGAVYQDVNGDGLCINTGVEGEDPVEGIEIFFLSSDKETTVSLVTGDNGTYGLAAAGQSIWEVTARPDPDKWIVTSENPLFVPVLPESEDGNTSLIQTDVNFCISEIGTTGTGGAVGTIVGGQGGNAIILLPESGGAAPNNSGQLLILATAVLGFILIVVGTGLELRRRFNR